jgi:hypothetical protein
LKKLCDSILKFALSGMSNQELIQFLEKLRVDGLTITPLGDKDEAGRRFALAALALHSGAHRRCSPHLGQRVGWAEESLIVPEKKLEALAGC